MHIIRLHPVGHAAVILLPARILLRRWMPLTWIWMRCVHGWLGQGLSLNREVACFNLCVGKIVREKARKKEQKHLCFWHQVVFGIFFVFFLNIFWWYTRINFTVGDLDVTCFAALGRLNAFHHYESPASGGHGDRWDLHHALGHGRYAGGGNKRKTKRLMFEAEVGTCFWMSLTLRLCEGKL